MFSRKSLLRSRSKREVRTMFGTHLGGSFRLFLEELPSCLLFKTKYDQWMCFGGLTPKHDTEQDP